jgi:glutathione synthase
MKFVYVASQGEWEDSLLPLNSTLELMLETMQRGHDVSIAYPHQIQSSGTGLLRKVDLEIGRDPMDYVNAFRADLSGNHPLIKRYDESLEQSDAIIWRTNPTRDPGVHRINYQALRTLQGIEDKVYIGNKPSGIIKVGSKESLLELPDGVPPRTVCISNVDEALEELFQERSGEEFRIVKPANGYGGDGVMRVRTSGRNDRSYWLEVKAHLELLTGEGDPVIVQQYLDVQKTGDKRVVLVGGDPVAALLRMPAEGEYLANTHKGGNLDGGIITNRDRWLAEKIKPYLLANGLDLVGMDVIDGHVTELNVNSMGGIPQIVDLCGLYLAPKVVELFEKRVYEF